jgi:bifunctional UDP-N-acetylglucosamine pyrophosphorylase/glucosamine-1-phosphate N-acetyltransferase
MDIKTVILAAGKGTRMKSDISKALHKVAGMAMIEWVTKAAMTVDEKPVIITSSDNELMKSTLGDAVDYVIQYEQKGTGHAVMMAKDMFPDSGYVVVVLGDMALLRGSSIQNLVDTTKENGWEGSVLTAIADNPFGYGRIVRDEEGNVTAIVEQRDATVEEQKINEINTGVMCFKANALCDTLGKIQNNNSQGEYYLTDTIKILVDEGKKMGAVQCEFEESLGVNDRAQLAVASKIMRKRINDEIMKTGVTIIDPDNTYISPQSKIGKDCIIYPGNVLEGECVIGENTTLYPNNHIENTIIGDGCMLRSSTFIDAKVGDNVTVGPNAYLRPKSIVGNGCRIGDFVEIKNSNIGDGTKVSHLTYIGDSDLGKNINVGCGVVFVNYDGKKKHRCVIGDNAFIGCNTNLVAPVTVGEGAYTAAGSTVIDNVPSDALAIARAKQTNKVDWAKKRREYGEL